MRDKSIQCDWTCTSWVQEAACEDAVAAYVDVAGFLFNVMKEDIICCEVGVPKWFKFSETVREEEPCEQNEVNEAISWYVYQARMKPTTTVTYSRSSPALINCQVFYSKDTVKIGGMSIADYIFADMTDVSG